MWYLHPEILMNIKISRIDGEYYISSFQEKERKCNPEEIIRQFLYIKLICHYGFSQERIRIEYPIQIGSTKRRADIVVLNNEMHPYVIAETKVKITEDSIAQLQSYINVTRANYGIVASQSEIAFFQSINDSLNSINDIPTSYRPIVDIFTRKEQPSDMMGFQKLYRINEENSIVVINDINITISNKSLLSYNRIKKITLSKGIVLPLNINDNRWHQIVKNLFESAEDVKDDDVKDETEPSADISTIKEHAVDMLCFQKLYRINEKKSIVVINDTKIEISNTDLISYNKIKNIALSKGIVIPLHIDKNCWHQIVKNLFESAEDVKGDDVKDETESSTDMSTIKEHAVDMLCFQKLYRINEKKSIVVINDTKIAISNTDLISYNKIKNIALSKGIVIPLHIDKNCWHQIVKNLFESAEDVKGLEGYDILNLNDVTEISILREIIVEMIARFKSDYQESGDEASAITQHCVVRKDKTVYIRIDSIMDALQFCRSKVLQKAERNEVLKMLKTIGFVRVDSPIWFSSARKGEGKPHRVWRIKLHQILTEKEIAIYESQGT